MSAIESARLFNSVVDTMLWDGGFVVAMHHVFIDESGTDAGAPVMAMAGYLFRHDQARRFSKDWTRELKKFGLPYAHMKEAIGPSGVYKHLSKQQADESNRLLIKHIHARALFGFSVAVSPEKYREIVSNDIAQTTIYSFLVACCMQMIGGWAKKRGYKGKVVYFFEAGHESWAEADKLLKSTSWWPDGTYAGHAFLPKAEAPPLQAADFFAWHARKYYVDNIRTGKKSYRADFQALLREQDVGYIADPYDLEDYRNNLILGRLDNAEIVSHRIVGPGMPGHPDTEPDQEAWAEMVNGKLVRLIMSAPEGNMRVLVPRKPA